MRDYLFESARVRAMEKNLITREQIGELCEAKDAEQLWHRLSELGVEAVASDAGGYSREETLLIRLQRTYEEMQALAPDEKALRLWLYPYDCNNLKAAIKGFFRKIDPRSMMFAFGTVGIEDMIAAVEHAEFACLTPAMRRAASEAMRAYSKTQNPQIIDLTVDRACYEDMLAAACESGSVFAERLVREKIDLTNLLIAVRILRMQSGENGRQLFEQALLAGGTIPTEEIRALFAQGERTIWNRLYYTAYGKLAEKLASKEERPLTEVERVIDDYWMAHVAEAKSAPYGLDVLIGFLLAYENESRNLRIVIAGKEAGLSPAIIRERIRESYV